MLPHEYSRRILVFVTGLTPQVVTETIFALAKATEVFSPTEIHVITTLEGARNIRLSLLSEEPGWFHQLCKDYDLGDIQFPEQNIHVLGARSSVALDDIRNEADNILAADEINDLIRQLTLDEDAAIHVSLAGGRKTMGYFIGSALSLFGREQDRLSHVLVNAPFESNREFFYPTPYPYSIKKNGEKGWLDAAEGEVTLAEIPFLRLRDLLPTRALEKATSYLDTILAASGYKQLPLLVINVEDQTILAAGEEIKLPPAEFAFYTWMAQRAKQGKEMVHWTDARLAEELLAVYQEVIADELSEFYLKACEALKNGMSKEFWDPRKSKINSAFKDALGVRAANPYLIATSGERPKTRSGIDLAPDQIVFAP